jgi:hypothetical protein
VKAIRTITAGAALALVAGSALIAVPANAADDYINVSQIGVEGSSYPAGWFVGAGSTGSAATTPSGLSVNGREQVLNGTPGTAPSGGLVELATNAHLGVVSGNADFQIPLFTDGSAHTGFTTLRPDNFNNPGLNPAAGWTTSGTVGTFAAGTSHTLAEYDAELATLPTAYELLAYGVIVPAGESAVISSITWNGTTTWFTPQPSGTATPSTISVTDFTTAGKGVAVHLTGFVPGESVDGGIGNGGSGGPTGQTFTADANGNVDFIYVYPNTGLTPGQYTLSGIASVSGVNVSASVTVVADPSGTPSAPVATPAVPIKGTASFTG